MLLITDLLGLIATTSVVPLFSSLKASFSFVSQIPMTTLSHFNTSINIFLIFENNELISLNSSSITESLLFGWPSWGFLFSVKSSFHPLFGVQEVELSCFGLFIARISEQLHNQSQGVQNVSSASKTLD